MVVIYSSSNFIKRIEYVAQHIFKNILGTDFEITLDEKFYLKQFYPCINYSTKELNHGLHIFPHGLLFENGVNSIKDLKESEYEGLFCFFYNAKGDIPFDVLAASFYLLTLYEEYFQTKKDEHGRFRHTDSFLFKKGLLETPIVDRWAYLLKSSFEKAGFQTDDFKLRQYRFISTFDIDHPFLYSNKGLFKNIVGGIRDLLKGNFKSIKERIFTVLRLQEDPYLSAMKTIHAVHSIFQKSYYLFILLGKKGKYGRSSNLPSQNYYNCLKMNEIQIGSHFSYDTLQYPELICKEKTELEQIFGQTITCSRQHFLRLQIPDTFRVLLRAGLKEDFTLTYASACGFRSGTAIPHLFYDLHKDETTILLLRPTVMMDTTLIMHQKLTPTQALEKMKKLVDACRLSGGDYLTLWHNSNLAYRSDENMWIRVFTASCHYAIEDVSSSVC